jgi:hypothetical protein
MFSDVVLLHGSNNLGNALQPGTVTPGERNVCSSEKMTQTGDGNVWSSPLPDHMQVIRRQYTRRLAGYSGEYSRLEVSSLSFKLLESLEACPKLERSVFDAV